MFDYLQKFNTLPQNLRESVSSPAAMAVISELEAKYKVDLAATVMKVMVKIIPLAELSIYFVSDFSLSEDLAKRLTADLKERLFFLAANYLGYNASYSSVLPRTVLAPINASKPVVAPNTFSAADKVIKEVAINFASLDLNYRLKNILTTYLKGVRSRVDTRFILNKEIITGGVGLDHKIIDKIFKICDEIRAGQLLPSGALVSLPAGDNQSKTGLDKIRELYEKPGSTRDIPYDLKAAITKGEIKKPEAPLNLPIPEETKEKLIAEFKSEPALVPLVLPKIAEVKISVPVPVPVIPLVAKIPIAKVVDSIKAVVAVAPVLNKVEEVKPVNNNPVLPKLDAIKPLINKTPVSPKIVRPPEKKPGLFSKLFSATKPVNPISVTPPVVLPIIKTGIATLRSEAAISQNKLMVNESIHQIINNDLKLVPKVMGPLEELRYLDIVNFRRFGVSPTEVTAKVESKIKLLEKDGYDNMVSGVAAWRESPVNSLYLKMGQEALAKNLSFKQYTANSQTQGQNNFLFWEEIEAIMALNGRLMF